MALIMIDRKLSSEKSRRHVNTIKQKPPLQFHKLLMLVDVSLPTQMQNFLLESPKFIDNERCTQNKIRVLLKINECKDTQSCLTVNKSQNCVGLIDPTPSRRSQTSNNNVNLFPFDAVALDSDAPNFLVPHALSDPIMEFIKGRDSCIFSFGHAGLGKTKSMIGSDQTVSEMGIIPSALAWTFKIIEYLRLNTKMRYSVRMSAIEVSNQNNVCDLLSTSNVSSRSVGDPKTQGTSNQDTSNTLLNNQRELPANNIVEAAHILDTALATRSNDNESLTHFQLIIHLYQYRVEAVEQCNRNSNTSAVRGERSRLYLLDLGSGRHGSEDQKILSLQGISKVILALYTSQRHLPYKENVLTQLLKNTLNPNISTTMLLHISSKEQNYSETLQVVQLAYKLYRMRSKRHRSVGFSVSDETSSCSSSSSGIQSRRLRPHMGIGAARRSSGNSSASSEFELTSASELSCCETVIFKGDTSHNVSDKSPDRLSGKRKLRSASSDSDNTFSDKDSKSVVFSPTGCLSPTILRRRRTSPRTNARVWPNTNEHNDNSIECSPELWVDGPNAVYKVEIEKENSNSPFRKAVVEEPTVDLSISGNVKSAMVLKVTQCDDVWDSGSSLTDGSSHSNTSDRKDNRPLSDISECTEETESNLAAESDIVKMNMIDQLEPTNVLDDLLDSTLGITPSIHDNETEPLEKSFLSSHNPADASQPLFDKMKYPSDFPGMEKPNEVVWRSNESMTVVESFIEKKVPMRRDSNVSRKHYHSASDSKRSSKSENKEIRKKTKCKSCSKKGVNGRSKSMTSSSSTDFSRVASWIENVEYEIHSKSNKSRIVYDLYNVDEGTRQMYHHHSQPDISHKQDLVGTNRSYFNSIQYPAPVPPNIPWVYNDSHQAQYSLYDGYQTTMKTEMLPTHYVSSSNVSFYHMTPAATQISPIQQMVTQREQLHAVSSVHAPKSGNVYPQSSNISLTKNSFSVTQLPLPPLPNANVFADTHVPRIDNFNAQCSYQTPPIANTPHAPLPANPKCKTLPRDIYSSSPTFLKRNKSDIISSKAADNRFCDLKGKDKSKKEHKNFVTILISSLKGLRKKISKSKYGQSTSGTVETDSEKPLEVPENNTQQLSCWPMIEEKLQSSLVISSPYNLVTQPKSSNLPTESSSHGSDSSSVHKKEVLKSRPSDLSRRNKTRSGSITYNSKNVPRQRPTSSGYGSINFKGDSEVSSHNDSSSEYSLSGINSGKVTRSQSRLKHSMSFSNYKLITDQTSSNLHKKETSDGSNLPSITRDINFDANVKIAEDLLMQEKLKMALNEERKIVIQLLEVNRIRGVPADPSVMNLMCFRCLDNFEIDGEEKRTECAQLIQKLEAELENLKTFLLKAQHNLFMVTSFDCSPQSQ